MKVKSVLWNGLSRVGVAIFEYDTPKIVHIKNKKVGVINRLVQLAIIAYIIVWGLIIDKGYQKTGPVAGIVTTKLKGASHYDGEFGDYTDSCSSAVDGDFNRTFDVGDYVIPPQEPNSFFVMTNLWQTCNQTQGLCAESASVFNSGCNISDPSNPHPDCVNPKDNSTGYVFEGGNGPTTGVCLSVTGENGEEVGRCEIRAWCEVENENDTISNAGPKIDASGFTVLVKNSIEFPTVRKGLRKRNIIEHGDEDLKTCRYNDSNIYCPIFSLGQIVDMIEEEQNFTELSIKGAVIGLEIHWDCDHLEFGIDNCNPKYVAKRYDNPGVRISPGYNFRYSRYYLAEDGKTQKRILTKAYGILFKLEIHGTGGKFDVLTVVLKIGSMIALLGIASVLSDIVVLYIVKSRSYYRDNKYQQVDDPSGDYEIIDRGDAKEMPKGNVQKTTESSDSFN